MPLDGLCVTGLGRAGLRIIQAYVDRTGDVQTAAILAAHAVPKHYRDPRADGWVETYRDLLDRWQLWHQRAAWDVAARRYQPDVRLPPSVVAACSFCQQSLVPAGANAAGRPAVRPTMIAAQRGGKQTMCPNPSCRKPLPRCAVCHAPLSLPVAPDWAASAPEASPVDDADGAHSDGDGRTGGALAALAQWITFCQTCRHGGHYPHLLAWFATHEVCPVADCTCRCRLRDRVDHAA